MSSEQASKRPEIATPDEGEPGQDKLSSDPGAANASPADDTGEEDGVSYEVSTVAKPFTPSDGSDEQSESDEAEDATAEQQESTALSDVTDKVADASGDEGDGLEETTTLDIAVETAKLGETGQRAMQILTERFGGLDLGQVDHQESSGAGVTVEPFDDGDVDDIVASISMSISGLEDATREMLTDTFDSTITEPANEASAQTPGTAKAAPSETQAPKLSAPENVNKADVEARDDGSKDGADEQDAKAAGADSVPQREGSPAENRALDVMNSMAEGAILWDESGLCVLCNPRASEILELSPDDMSPGMPRDDFFEAGVVLGAFTRDRADEIKTRFASGLSFSYEHTTATGREIKAQARPCARGGYVVTLSDVSDLRVQELIVAKAKEKAEKAQAELAERLADLTLEKIELEAQRAELERTALVATHASDLVYITNPQGRIEWINRAFQSHTGYQLADVDGKFPLDLLTGPESQREEVQKLRDGFRERKTTRAELLLYTKNEQTFWFKCEVIPIFSSDGRNTHFISVGRDVTERRRAWREAEQGRLFEQRKREESHLLTEFNEWLQSCDTQGEMFRVVQTFLARLLPHCPGSVYVYAKGRDILEGVCNWNGAPILPQIDTVECWGLRRGRTYIYGDNEIAFACDHAVEQYGDNLPACYCCVPISAHGDTVGLLHVDIPVNDIDGRKLTQNELSETQKLVNICAEQISLAIANLKLREQLREQSVRDVLTGLFNRRFFTDMMTREIARSAVSKQPVSLIMFDVDKFKLFNDTHGHDAGDAVLKSIADIMTAQFTGKETPCRFGGEEFIVMLPGVSREQAAKRAEILRETIEDTPVTYGSQSLSVTISAGFCTYPQDGDGLNDLIKLADQALYRAKEDGRNRVIAGASVASNPLKVSTKKRDSSSKRINSRVR